MGAQIYSDRTQPYSVTDEVLSDSWRSKNERLRNAEFNYYRDMENLGIVSNRIDVDVLKYVLIAAVAIMGLLFLSRIYKYKNGYGTK